MSRAPGPVAGRKKASQITQREDPWSQGWPWWWPERCLKDSGALGSYRQPGQNNGWTMTSSFFWADVFRSLLSTGPGMTSFLLGHQAYWLALGSWVLRSREGEEEGTSGPAFPDCCPETCQSGEHGTWGCPFAYLIQTQDRRGKGAVLVKW